MALMVEAGPLTLDGVKAMLNLKKYAGHREALCEIVPVKLCSNLSLP